MEKMDLTVFKKDFDAHNRGRQCLRTLKGIEANVHPVLKKQLSLDNQKKLIEYSANLIVKIKRQELSLSSFEKYLAGNWKFCLDLREKSVADVTEVELKVWWEQELARYDSKIIKWATLRKEYECCQHFLKWVKGINHKHQLPLMENLYIPKQPKAKLMERMPSQEEVKQLIDAAYSSDKFSLRNQAILALANDTGARISEILSMQNKHIRPEKNYLVVSFPESKTAPRTVISYLAKPYLENWAKISPNKDKGPDSFFFCQGNGESITYATVMKAFHRAMKKVDIPWKKDKALHFFRNILASRAYNWAYGVKHYWFGWSLQDHERAYSSLNYQQCIEPYFIMIKKENNPMFNEETPYWADESIDDKIMKKLIEEKPEFKLLLKQIVREIAST